MVNKYKGITVIVQDKTEKKQEGIPWAHHMAVTRVIVQGNGKQ